MLKPILLKSSLNWFASDIHEYKHMKINGVSVLYLNAESCNFQMSFKKQWSQMTFGNLIFMIFSLHIILCQQ